MRTLHVNRTLNESRRLVRLIVVYKVYPFLSIIKTISVVSQILLKLSSFKVLRRRMTNQIMCLAPSLDNNQFGQ